MKRYNFFLPEQISEALRAHAEKTGLSSSELIRRAITEYLAKL